MGRVLMLLILLATPALADDPNYPDLHQSLDTYQQQLGRLAPPDPTPSVLPPSQCPDHILEPGADANIYKSYQMPQNFSAGRPQHSGAWPNRMK